MVHGRLCPMLTSRRFSERSSHGSLMASCGSLWPGGRSTLDVEVPTTRVGLFFLDGGSAGLVLMPSDSSTNRHEK
jgi:hypothetical protein